MTDERTVLDDLEEIPITQEEWAIHLVRKGYFLFPCWPKTKAPAVSEGLNEASNDESVIRDWWRHNPNYNPAINLGKSGLVVYDFDKIAPFENQLPTFTVQTGRVPENGVRGIQMYYHGSAKTHSFGPDGGHHKIIDGRSNAVGEVRSRGAYVMAPGSIHPSGNTYKVILDLPLAESPEQNVEEVKSHQPAMGTDEQEAIRDYVEGAFDLADVNYESAVRMDNGGFKWLVICPWAAEHTSGKNFDSSSAVIMQPSGMRLYCCKHSHCDGIRQWKELRAFMEEKVGHKLVFGDPKESTVLTAGPDGLVPAGTHSQYISNYVSEGDKSAATLLIFAKQSDTELARALGFDAVTLDFAQGNISFLENFFRVVAFVRTPILVPHLISVSLKKEVTKDYLDFVLGWEAIKNVSKEAARSRWVKVTENAAPMSDLKDPQTMPASALASTKLGDLYGNLFEPNEFPLEIAVPALITAASVLVPPLDVNGVLIPGDDFMVNLYTALIGDVHCGKSQAIEWACKALGIYQAGKSPWYLENKFGSTEMMLKYLKKELSTMRKNFLINPDEWSFLFTKAGISNSSFTSFMTTSFYRRRQIISVGNRVGEVHLNNALSFIAGIVAEEFDTVFNATTLGGTYDRFLFGHREGWMWSYRPFPQDRIGIVQNWEGNYVQRDGSLFEVVKTWNKQNPGMGRIIEICTRVAAIYASIDGRPVITGKDLENLSGLAQNQFAIRRQFNPNAGLTPDAQFANAVVNWLTAHTKGEWVNLSFVKRGVHAYEMKLGPNVAERAIGAMVRSSVLDGWFHTAKDGKPNELPSDWVGPRPRVGLIRLVKT